jgi:hypothetical protein
MDVLSFSTDGKVIQRLTQTAASALSRVPRRAQNNRWNRSHVRDQRREYTRVLALTMLATLHRLSSKASSFALSDPLGFVTPIRTRANASRGKQYLMTSALFKSLEPGHQIFGPRERNLGSLFEGSRALELVLGRVLKRAKRFTAECSVCLDNRNQSLILGFGLRLPKHSSYQKTC